MDRVISTASVAFGSADTAPSSGTPQYFTNGNPTTSTPATVLPGYFLNMLQDEIRAVIVAAGITPDGTNWSQLLQALFALPGKNRQVFTASGTFTVPAGVTKVRATVVGGGASGGGTTATTSTQVSAAPGGNGGSWGIGTYSVTPAGTVAVTVGAGGVWSSGGGSGGGGTSSFGAFLSAPGGTGGLANVPANPPPLIQAAAGSIAVATGGFVNVPEAPAGFSIAQSTANFIGGLGGGGPFGVGGSPPATGAVNGNPGGGYGAGGSGAITGISGAQKAGGLGTAGIVIVEW